MIRYVVQGSRARLLAGIAGGLHRQTSSALRQLVFDCLAFGNYTPGLRTNVPANVAIQAGVVDAAILDRMVNALFGSCNFVCFQMVSYHIV